MIIDTQDYNVCLKINDDISVVFIHVPDGDTSSIEKAIADVDLSNEDAVIILWLACNRFYAERDSVSMLNNFYRSVKNPMVLFSGSLTADTSTLDFIHQPVNLFQYISKIEQPRKRTILPEKFKKFLFLSTKNYWSRCYILQHLIKNYADQGYISYRCLQDRRSVEPYLEIPKIIESCQLIEHLLPYGGLKGENDDNLYHVNKPEYAINNTYLSILTETFYDGPVYLSEKVFYSMLYHHFFIYAGPAHTLKYLRSIGFKTFSHIIDESYDDIVDPVERLYAVVASIEKFVSKPIEEIKRLYIENSDILSHNRSMVLATEINELVNDTLYRAIKLKNTA